MADSPPDPQGEAVHIYHEVGSTEIKKNDSIVLSAEDIMPGFVMELNFQGHASTR